MEESDEQVVDSLQSANVNDRADEGEFPSSVYPGPVADVSAFDWEANSPSELDFKRVTVEAGSAYIYESVNLNGIAAGKPARRSPPRSRLHGPDVGV